jgi:hypothetical protein
MSISTFFTKLFATKTPTSRGREPRTAEINPAFLSHLRKQCEVITFRRYIEEHFPGIPDLLREMLDEDGDDAEEDLAWVQQLLEVPVEDLLGFVQRGLLKASECSEDASVMIRDLLKFVDIENRDWSFLD